MNKETKEDQAVIEYAEKNGCTIAAAWLRIAESLKPKHQSKSEKPANGT